MRTLWIAIVVGAWLMGSFPAHAKIYKWVDENGKVHFTDDPTRLPQKENSKIETIRELPPLPVKKANPEEQSPFASENPLPIQSEGDHVDGEQLLKQKAAQKKEEPGESLAQQKESYQKLLDQARETWQQKQKLVEEMESTGEKPKDWHTKESLDQIIERYKKHMERAGKDISKYEQKIKSLSLTD